MGPCLSAALQAEGSVRGLRRHSLSDQGRSQREGTQTDIRDEDCPEEGSDRKRACPTTSSPQASRQPCLGTFHHHHTKSNKIAIKKYVEVYTFVTMLINGTHTC